MPVYEYKGLTEAGKNTRGVRDADNLKALRAALRKDGIFLTEVTAEKAAAGGAGGAAIRGREVNVQKLLGSRVGSSDIAIMTRQLAVLIGAGVALVEGLSTLQDQLDHPRLKLIISQVKTKVNEGASLADAMAQHPKVFSPLYVNMIRAGEHSGALDVVLVQMVNLIKGGRPYKMSKRAGTFVTLRDVVDEAGADATRVMFLMKRADAQLEFDLDLVKRQTMENPVFYVQYGHARCANIFKKAREAGIEPPATFDLDLVSRQLTHPDELSLIKHLLDFPALVAAAALSREPHRVLFYVRELSAEFQAFYTRGKKEPALRVVQADNAELTQARLILVGALKTVFKNALHLLGVSAPEWMEAPAVEEERAGEACS